MPKSKSTFRPKRRAANAVSSIKAHTVDQGNPHGVTAQEVGAPTSQELAEHVNDPLVDGAYMELNQGTVTTDTHVIETTSTWNNALVAFRGWVARFVETARATTSLYLVIYGGAAGDDERFSVGPNSARLTTFDNPAFLEARAIGTAAGIAPNQRMRRLRGTVAAPTPALSGDTLGSSTYHGTTGAARAGMHCTATEDHTGAGRGAKWRLETCRNGEALGFPSIDNVQGEAMELNGYYVSPTQRTFIKKGHAVAVLSALSGAAVTAAGLIPRGAVVLGVTTRVITALGVSGGTTGYQVGDGVDVDRWGDRTATAAGSKTGNADWTADTFPPIFLANQDVVVTAKGGNFDGVGALVVDVAYFSGDAV